MGFARQIVHLSLGAWIVSDSEKGSDKSQFKKILLGPRVLDGKASNLTFKVPAPGELVLTVTKAKG
jgi:hypothetical protein